jgi:hypothetical protein
MLCTSDISSTNTTLLLLLACVAVTLAHLLYAIAYDRELQLDLEMATHEAPPSYDEITQYGLGIVDVDYGNDVTETW